MTEPERARGKSSQAKGARKVADTSAPSEKKSATEVAVSKKPRLPVRIVAIGASAGGIEALELFFDAMGIRSGVAFVIIQHLSPDFRSVMDELLARHTRMQIRTAKSGLGVKPNVIYLRPARQTLIIKQGRFVLNQEDKTTHLNFPIDAFLKSLANDQREKAIAIILSGTGTDGTLGSVAIREAGGTVLAQEPDSARFDSMPRSIIERNLANASASPKMLPQLLQRLLNGKPLQLANEHEGEEAGSGDPESRILQLLQRRCGADFGHYKKTTVGRRIRRRAEMANIDNFAAYAAKLEREPEEIDLLSKDLLIGVTSFFRDPDAFNALVKKVLPRIMANVSAQRPLRVWVPGCATGEEAYSIAILLSEHARKEGIELHAKIFATDIYRPALERASRGVYDEQVVKPLGPELLDRYFEATGDRFVVKPKLRRVVVFSAHNLLRDPPFTRMDFVSCRNLLIYFDEVAQHTALLLFHFALDRNGILFLGPSEAVNELSDEFGVVDQHWRIFRKLRDVRLRESLRLPPSTPPRDETASNVEARFPSPVIPGGDPARSAAHRRGLAKAYDALLDRFAPAGVLATRNGTILHVFGDAHRFLEFKSGRFSPLITNAAAEELRHTISAGLERMRDRNVAPFARRVPCRLGKDSEHTVKVMVERLNGPEWQDEDYCLITFAEVAAPKEGAGKKAKAKIESVGTIEIYQERVHDLENELRVTEENLQTTIEEMETSNEELQATNEEMMSANEELQSTNEELNSVNEELLSVSVEHQRKIDELVEVTTDMDHLLKGTDIGVIYLDRELRVRRLTPAIARTFNLREQDIGRPIEHITARFHHPDLINEIRSVLNGGTANEYEIAVEDRAFLLRMLPYQVGAEIAGAILVLIDITQRKHIENALRRAEHAAAEQGQRARSLIETATDGILIANSSGLIHVCNHAACELLDAHEADIIGKRADRLFRNRDVNTQPLIEHLIAGGQAETPKRFEISLERRDQQRHFDVVLSAFDLEGEAYRAATLREITELYDARESLAAAKKVAEEANSAKTNFLTKMSHELRTPLNAIVGFSDAILNEIYGRLDHDRYRSYINDIHSSGVHLLGLINDVFDIAKIEAGMLRLHEETVDLVKLVSNAVSSVGPLASKAGVIVVFDFKTPPVTLRVDELRVRQVLLNVLSNAIKFSHCGGKVRVTVGAPDENGLSVEVADDGIGIDEEAIKKIGTEFISSANVRSGDKEGSGLGLPVSFGLMKAHGGGLHIESAPGKGTIVTLKFGADRVLAPARPNGSGAGPGSSMNARAAVDVVRGRAELPAGPGRGHPCA